ncbi:lipopolysaccharide assembly protein LapB [Thiohalorhabdus methylotrophus]|uniref:Lipopolysaccharide assembly protein B n=1 Tax=Thiohalorhabdus methylotrophus TaxID=3242694 RepID=A0ABV4U0J3_9GAMM
MPEYWTGGLLLLAVGIGYVWGRWRTVDPSPEDRSDGSSPSYFQGLYHLLNEQPDQAIEAFLDVARVEPETVDAHLALGNLFRRRGEVDRALRIHQNLIARPNLGRDQRDHAMYQLGLDYQKAGLLDRARQVFTELVERNRQYAPAVQSMVEITEQEREWTEALEWRKQLARIHGQGDPVAESLIHCEMAAEALARNDLSRAQQSIRRAYSVDNTCVRVSTLAGQLHTLKGNDRKAVREWERIVRQQPQHLVLVLDELVAAYHRLGEAEALKGFLRETLQAAEHPSLFAALTIHLAREVGAEEALRYVSEGLTRHPNSAELVNSFVGMWKDQHEAEAECDEILEVIQPYLEQARARQSRFVCTNCGFKSAYMQWKCPQCRQWGTLELQAA